MRGWCAVIVALSLGPSNIAFSQTAPDAQPASPGAEMAAPMIGAEIALKAAGGNFEFVKRKLPCENGRFSTKISFSQLTPKYPWESALMIILRNEDQHVLARFKLTTKETATSYLYASFDSGKKARVARFWDLVHPGEPVQIAVIWLDSKTVVATMGKEKARLTLKAPVDELELAVSGGLATFANNLLECAKK